MLDTPNVVRLFAVIAGWACVFATLNHLRIMSPAMVSAVKTIAAAGVAALITQLEALGVPSEFVPVAAAALGALLLHLRKPADAAAVSK